MPGSHLDCEVDRDRAEMGVSIALAEAALRAAGGIPDWSAAASVLSSGRGIWTVSGCGRAIDIGG